MSFKELDLKPTYTSSKDNLIDDFYSPVLSESIKYDRTAGFFNSTSLALVARGLKEFIINGGKMRLLCGVQLSEDDLHTIIHSSEIVENITEDFLKDLNSIYDEIQLNHLKLLAWMLENNILEIKIGIVRNEYGLIGGILHDKTGIFHDDSGNTILFSGSNNETGAGWSSAGFGNLEKFKVFVSWEDKKFMDEDIISFERDWNNENEYLEVMDVPKAAKEGLIKLAPDNIRQVLSLPMSYGDKDYTYDPRDLREYQEEAIEEWVSNNFNGIFKMATGTGKTFTALNGIKILLEDTPNLLIVIACPLAHLAEQWATNVEKFFDIPTYNIYSSANTKWKEDLLELTFNMGFEILDKAIIITTHNTFSMDFFTEKINDLKIPCLLIVDEMHHVASSSFSKGLLDIYDYRLGLSATPEIYNDEEATDFLINYFGGIIFSFDLDDALTGQDEKGETFLTPYDYMPKKVSLTEEEFESYNELSKKIARASHFNEDEMSESYKKLIFKRKNIINNAEEKYHCLRKIINYYDDLDHLIIFCSPQQLDKVLKILEEEGVYPNNKFTYDIGTIKKEEFGGISHREYLVEKFEEGTIKSLVAIKCLDEGIDIPSAEKVIIMSSSNNPREYVQRRGRVLRRSEGKDKAVIYDMAVIQKDSYGDLVDNIVESEKIRLLDFINSSANPDYGMNLLEKWKVIL